MFLAHLLRLHEQDRLERFGSFSSEHGFFESYVGSINFENTLVLGIFLDGVLRASAELRSLHSHWGKEAELAIIVERPWHGLGLSSALVRNVLSRAKELGIRELFIHSDLEKRRSAKLLRLLGKELRDGTSAGLLSVDLYVSRDEESGAEGVFMHLDLDGCETAFWHSARQHPAKTGANQETGMALQLGDTAPDFVAQTTEGPIHFHNWLGDSWGILFSHPKNFTPVCTTELGAVAALKSEFDRRNVKVMGLSADPVSDHLQWRHDIEDVTGHALNFPLAGDWRLKIAKLYGMLPAEAGEWSDLRTPEQNQTVRSVFLIDPAKKIRSVLMYPMEAGRNFGEILRLVDALQLADRHKVTTPANWKPGEDVVIALSLSDEEAKKKFPAGWKTVNRYIRVVPQPG